MRTIKFSHRYLKLELDRVNLPLTLTASLLEVLNVNLENLSAYFLTYDTMFYKGEGHMDLYDLPKKGKYLLLIFEKNESFERSIFTTLRRETPEKEKYYRDSIGESFKVIIEEENK